MQMDELSESKNQLSKRFKYIRSNKSSYKNIQMQKMDQIDDLLTKNQEIYKNLRKKLQGIAKAQRNITNNLNQIRPISYATRQRLQTSYQQRSLNETQIYYRPQIAEDYISSSIQTERLLNQSLRKRINGQNQSNLKINTNNLSSSKLNANTQHLGKTDESKLGLASQSIYEIEKNHGSFFNRDNSLKARQQTSSQIEFDSFTNLRNCSMSFLEKEKENFYLLNRTMPVGIDSVERLNFEDLACRKGQIQKIYLQLREQQEQIEKAFQQYKRGFGSLNVSSVGKQQQKRTNSPPKKSSPKKSFSKFKKHQGSPQKMFTISKKQQSYMQENDFGNVSKTIQTIRIPQATQNNSPSKLSVIRYCTQQFESLQIPNKPHPISAKCHIYIPFNKLYKSPIIQMKNQNTLILARQSKVFPQKTNQNKIVDGKKYKFSNSIQTDEQELIKNVLREDHNVLVIVGGQSTLKKKLHMAFIAHAFDRIFKIIYSKQYNCLTLNVSYCEFAQKVQNSQVKIQNSVQITEQTTIKMSVLQIQKTIQQICEAIRKPHNPVDTGLGRATNSTPAKDKPKVIRFTKISLLTGKQYVWSCHILSTNQYSFQFLKNLQMKHIIWSINPLVKNYDQVSKTLTEAQRYSQQKN